MLETPRTPFRADAAPGRADDRECASRQDGRTDDAAVAGERSWVGILADCAISWAVTVFKLIKCICCELFLQNAAHSTFIRGSWKGLCLTRTLGCSQRQHCPQLTPAPYSLVHPAIQPNFKHSTQRLRLHALQDIHTCHRRDTRYGQSSDGVMMLWICGGGGYSLSQLSGERMRMVIGERSRGEGRGS